VPAPKQRLNSLDILRGLTMLGMILVDNSGPHPPWWLDHAEWNGLTPADLIFPSFIFIMGMAVPLAMSKSKPFSYRSVLRILGLFAIGVFLNLSARKFTFGHCKNIFLYL
jgi:predicted acyltransferase